MAFLQLEQLQPPSGHLCLAGCPQALHVSQAVTMLPLSFYYRHTTCSYCAMQSEYTSLCFENKLTSALQAAPCACT
jgi:hypothetical protein